MRGYMKVMKILMIVACISGMLYASTPSDKSSYAQWFKNIAAWTISWFVESEAAKQERYAQERKESNSRALKYFNIEIQRRESDITEVEKEEAIKFGTSLLAHYNPTIPRCRAGIIAIDQEPFYKANDAFESLRLGEGEMLEIACMIAGFKSVISGHLATFNMYCSALKNLLRLQKIDYLIIPDRLEGFPEMLVFTPAGRQNALLLIKEKFDGLRSWFLFGRLLGYWPVDIKALYIKQHASFSVDEKEANNWLRKNKPDIEKWAAEHIDPAAKTLRKLPAK